MSVADVRLNGNFKEEMGSLLILGLNCCNPNPNNRYSIKLVLKVLSGKANAHKLSREIPAFAWPAPSPPFLENQDCLARHDNMFSAFSSR
ncbi:hypothetical protein LINGRAHAP2_LOCUS377 [Linum grandiflorum]